MGFQLFESSGTFKPTDWGLKVGDVITVICVGGGASGGHCSGTAGSITATAGANGGTTSFGSYCTAVGGTGNGTDVGLGRGAPLS